MKALILIVSLGALVCTGLVAWVLFSSDRFASFTDAVLLFLGLVLVSWVLALMAGVRSAGNARRLWHLGWSRLLAFVTLLGVGSSCSGVLDYVWHSVGVQSAVNAFPQGQLNQVIALIVVPVAVSALTALLSVFLLRPGTPKPAKPAGGSS